MGQRRHFHLFLLVAAIVGFSLLKPGRCEREARQSFQDSDNITPFPLIGGNNGWRPVISPMSVTPSRSPSYRYIGNTGSGSDKYSGNTASGSDKYSGNTGSGSDKYNGNTGSGSDKYFGNTGSGSDKYTGNTGSSSDQELVKITRASPTSSEERYRDNREYVNNNNNNNNKQYSYSSNVGNIVKGKKKNVSSPHYESRPSVNNNNENRHQMQHFELDDIITSSSVVDIMPSNDDPRQYNNNNNYKNVRETTSQPSKHPVINKLHLHMDSAEKEKKKREQVAVQSARVETFVTTPSSLLGSFSEFGHATVRSREPASSKQDVVRGKKKDTYQVTPSNNEYSMHLVPPPRFPPSPARYPDMMKKPYMPYRFPKPDLLVDEQRHVYYVHAPPHRPAFFPPPHTPRPNGPYYGPPSIPNFAGLNSPHHYTSSMNGGVFPGNEEIKYYQRPDVQKPGGNQYQPPTRAEQVVVVSQSTPTAQPLLSVNTRHPQDPLNDSNNQGFERPDSPPFKNTLHQEEIVTGRPVSEVRGSEGATFTVGSSFLAGNKQENGPRPHHITSQTFHGQGSLSPFSTISPITFEQAFNTARPNPAHEDGGRLTRPYFTEDRPTNFQHVQNTGAISHKLPIIQSPFHKEVIDVKIEGTTPHFLPTRNEEQSYGNDLPRRKQPTPPTHLNEVHHVSRPWSEPFPPAEVAPIIDIDVQAHAHTTFSPPARKPSRRPSLQAHRRPQPQPEREEYGVNDYREAETSSRRPVVHEEETLEHVAPTRGRPTESRQPEVTTGYPFVEEETFDQVTPTKVYRPKGNRHPVSSTGAPATQDQREKSPPARGNYREPETSTARPFVQEVDTADQDEFAAGSRIKDTFESSTGGSLLEEAGITEEVSFQQTTVRPTQSDIKIRRPQPSRKPSRYRPNSQSQEEKESWSQSTEKPHRRTHSRFTSSTTAEPERKPLDDVISPQKEVRPHQRRRRPQHTTEAPVTVPAQPEVTVEEEQEEEQEEQHLNQVAYPSLNELFDKIPLSSQAEFTRQTTTTTTTTTERPARRRTPYISTRGHDRNHPRDEDEEEDEEFDDVKLPISSDEITTLADAPEPQTGLPEAEDLPPVRKISDYSVHEVSDEGIFESLPEVDLERFHEDLTTSTSTSTEAPATTSKSTGSRYKPRVRFGTNSTRPRFSVKDYKDRINRLPQSKTDDATPKTTPEVEPHSRTRYQSKVRGTYKKTDESNKSEQDSSSETESPMRMKYPSRVRGGPYHKPDVSKTEKNESGTESTTETIRTKFRPKFGSGSSRFRTTTTTASPAVGDGEGATEKTEVKSSTGRIRMPTGKYFSRYRSTTEDNKDPIEEAASSIEITSTSKPAVRTKNIFSASKRRYPSRGKYGSHAETSSTEQTEYDESITSRIEEILQKLNSSRISSTEASSTFPTTKQDQDESTLSLQNTFPGDFEETSKAVTDNEIKTPATRTFVFMPTMPTTREEGTDKSVPTEASVSGDKNEDADKKAVTEESDKKIETDIVKPADEEMSPSQRVADLTSAATSGGYFNVMSLVKRKPFQYSVTSDEHILPIEAFFSNKEYIKDSHSK